MKPSVSVLMTSYNHVEFVADAIKSVLNSSFEDFELIITDDGSSDGSVDIIQELAETDDRIRFYRNEKNLGDYPNRNKAASYARGKYLKYVDDDDLIYPWGLKILFETMEKFPGAGWGLCSLNQDIEKPFPFQLTGQEAYRYHYFGPGLFHKAPLSSIIHRKLFEQVGGFKPVRIVGDKEMWHRLALTSPVVLMSHGIVWHRSHPNQESSFISDYKKEYDSIRNTFFSHPECPLSKAEISEILKNQKKQEAKAAILRSVKKLMLWS